jgi:hypothetical protein
MTIKSKRPHSQLPLNYPSTKTHTNLPFGNLITTKLPSIFRIFLQNVNGIYKSNSWEEWKSFSALATELHLDAVCMTEPNLNWNTKLEQSAQSLSQRFTKNCRLSTSSNTTAGFGYYQPGGTTITILAKATGCITAKISDSSSMGRWSGFKLHTNGSRHINIITVYQATKSDGIHTNYMHQISTLKQQGQSNPDPRKQLFTDLQLVIQAYNKINDLTIILIDANDSLYNRQFLLPTFMYNTKLVPLIFNPEMYPPTHNRGSHCIDFILGFPQLVHYIEESGMTRYFEQPWPNTDHRGLFIDINTIRLFGATLQSIPETVPRKVTSKSMKIATKFALHLSKINLIPELLQQLQDISHTTHWTANHSRSIDLIDFKFTTIFLEAESKCAVPTDTQWSSDLHNKFLTYTF